MELSRIENTKRAISPIFYFNPSLRMADNTLSLPPGMVGRKCIWSNPSAMIPVVLGPEDLVTEATNW